MTYKDILYVVSTYEARSISAAAKSLYISQSALSQSIRKLEDELGMPLFIRTGSRLEPTKGCDFFVARGRDVLRAWTRFDMDLRQFVQGRQSALTIGFPAAYFANLLPFVLPRYEKAHPEVKVSVLEEPSDTLEKMVMQNTLDFCLVRDPIHTASIATEPLLTTEMLLALPKDHPYCLSHPYRGLNHLEYADLFELKDTPFALLKHPRIDHMWRPLFAANGFEPLVQRRSRAWSNLRYFVRQGNGAAIMDEIPVRTEPDEAYICYYRISRGNVRRRIMLAFHPDKVFTPHEQHFIDMLRQYPTLHNHPL